MDAFIRQECDFSCDEQICKTLDKAGVPPDEKWRTLILYLRSLKDYTFLTDQQKVALQALMVQTLKQRDFSDENFENLLKEKEQILASPYLKKLQGAVRETQDLITEFKNILCRRKGNVEELGNETLKVLEEEDSPEGLINQLRNSFKAVVSAMEADAQNLVRISNTDSLTNLNNRRALDEHLASVLARWLGKQEPVCLLMIDIDHFKKFNDTFGHRIGDQALTTVGKLIKEYCQDQLSQRENVESFAARYGGEEFALVLTGMELEDAGKVANDVLERISRYNFIIRDVEGNVVQRGIKITVSIGVCTMDPQWRGVHMENLVETADKALYQAKFQGRNRVVLYMPDTNIVGGVLKK